MLTACWSVKGGSGTTVIAASLVVALKAAGRPVVAADLGGDLPLTLGLPDPPGPGLLDWMAAGPDVPRDALVRLAHSTSHGITLLGRGSEPYAHGDSEAGRRLAKALRAVQVGAPIIADAGRLESAAATAFAEAADRSLLVLRPCYLALRRAVNAPRPSAVVLVTEAGRSLCARDVEDILGVPVVTEIAWEPAIAKAVDTGLLIGRMPRHLVNAMRGVAA